MEAIQSGAAMQGGGGSTPTAAPLPRDLVPLDAPTARPEEPVTAGMDAYAATPPNEIDDTTRQRLLGALPTLLWLASNPKASEQTRQWVRQVRGDL